MDVSVIIVNYNTGDLLNDCLNSIIEITSDVSYEIIVIDNGSQDDSIKLAQKNHLDIIYVINNKNVGFAAANNKAAKQAKGEYLFFLNPDTVLVNNAVKLFYDYMINHANVGACGGVLLDENNQNTYSYGDFPTLREVFYNAFQLRRIIPRNWFPCSGRIPLSNFDDLIEVDYIVGADLFFKASLFRELVGFDERFIAYFEETDLCFRLKKDHHKVTILIPEAKIIHLQGKSFKTNFHKIKMYIESEIKYFYKRNKIKAYLDLIIHYTSSVLLYLIFSLFKRKGALYFKEKLNSLFSLPIDKILKFK
jgi:GT2 family glycosyltransferase